MNMTQMLTVIHASAHDLSQIADGAVQCIVTSPPYWGLRAYAGDQDVEWPAVTYRLNEWTEPITIPEWRGPLGLEPSPVAYIGHLILCLREWNRVVRSDGVCWVNLGDSYAGSWGDSGHRPERSGVPGHQREKSVAFFDRKGHPQVNKPVTASVPGLKPKDLVGIPFLFALAARADGWWLRSSIPWIKRNGMPGSQGDRPTNSHEMWFMLTKSPTYYYDQEAIKMPISPASKADGRTKRADRGTKGEYAAIDGNCGFDLGGRIRRTSDWFFDSMQAIMDGANALLQDEDGEPLALVVNAQPYKEAHYAVFPERLIKPLILASTSEAGCCPSCGSPWRRQIEKPDMKDRPTRKQDAKSNTDAVHVSNNWQDHPKSAGQEYQEWRNANPDVTTGWAPTCTCNAGDPEPCVVLDPFAGSGTTARVAIRLGLWAILADMSDEYLADLVPARTTVQMEML